LVDLAAAGEPQAPGAPAKRSAVDQRARFLALGWLGWFCRPVGRVGATLAVRDAGPKRRRASTRCSSFRSAGAERAHQPTWWTESPGAQTERSRRRRVDLGAAHGASPSMPWRCTPLALGLQTGCWAQAMALVAIASTSRSRTSGWVLLAGTVGAVAVSGPFGARDRAVGIARTLMLGGAGGCLGALGPSWSACVLGFPLLPGRPIGVAADSSTVRSISAIAPRGATGFSTWVHGCYALAQPSARCWDGGCPSCLLAPAYGFSSCGHRPCPPGGGLPGDAPPAVLRPPAVASAALPPLPRRCTIAGRGGARKCDPAYPPHDGFASPPSWRWAWSCSLWVYTGLEGLRLGA